MSLEDPDPSNVGWYEYLLIDWLQLRDPKCARENRYTAYHSGFLRNPNRWYAKEIKWRGPIPRTEAVSDLIAAMLN